jgi:hypothetical protein
MNLHLPQRPLWATASFSADSDTLPADLSDLGQHVQQCSQRQSRLVRLQHGADVLHRGLLARFVTSLALLVALVGAAVLVF